MRSSFFSVQFLNPQKKMNTYNKTLFTLEQKNHPHLYMICE